MLTKAFMLLTKGIVWWGGGGVTPREGVCLGNSIQGQFVGPGGGIKRRKEASVITDEQTA